MAWSLESSRPWPGPRRAATPPSAVASTEEESEQTEALHTLGTPQSPLPLPTAPVPRRPPGRSRTNADESRLTSVTARPPGREDVTTTASAGPGACTQADPFSLARGCGRGDRPPAGSAARRRRLRSSRRRCGSRRRARDTRPHPGPCVTSGVRSSAPTERCATPMSAAAPRRTVTMHAA